MTSIETKSVSTFYKKNASNFSKTRVNPWPSTIKFINSLPPGSKVLDIGCGNGRNLFYRSDIDITGLEMSQELCDIVIEKGGNVIQGNMINLPFDDNTFDYIICIAVYHHLDNAKDREQALNEMYRILKPNGKSFIQVWAMEQPLNSKRKFMKRDELVPWKNIEGDGQYTILYRYYRIYPKGELEDEIKKYVPKFNIDSIIYEAGNWINIISKNL
jgi:ubiquinone/menaquinone biosynthesis C-methylase UbiE